VLHYGRDEYADLASPISSSRGHYGHEEHVYPVLHYGHGMLIIRLLTHAGSSPGHYGLKACRLCATVVLVCDASASTQQWIGHWLKSMSPVLQYGHAGYALVSAATLSNESRNACGTCLPCAALWTHRYADASIFLLNGSPATMG
jgi:hypothetical protein